VKFLDVSVGIDAGRFITSLFCKPTDCHKYLHYESSHPAYVKRSIVYSQGLRIKKICSCEEDFEKHLQEQYSWLKNRAYPTWLTEREFKRVKEYNIEMASNTLREEGCKTGVPLTIAFHPLICIFCT
jgi:hypothetical protein